MIEKERDSPENSESLRVAALSSYLIRRSRPEPRFDRLTRLAADIFETPLAWVSIIDEQTQWLKAGVGVPFRSTAREGAFCSYTIQQDGVLVVPDAEADCRFTQSPMVIGAPHVRFYAGAPITTQAGHALGAMCIADTSPGRAFGERDARLLKELASMAAEQMELRRTEVFLASMLGFADATGLAIVTTDGTGQIEFVNRKASELFGYNRDEMIGRSIDLIVPTRMRGAHRSGLARIAGGAESKLSGKTIEVTAARRDGTEFPIEISLSVWHQSDHVGIGAVIRDISERRQRDVKLMRLAHHDPLTGLSNRRFFQDALAEAMSRGHPGLLLLDLDGFKEVNDSQGHGVGDTLLQAVAIRLPTMLPREALIARFGGDEFAVLLPNAGTAYEELAEAATAILKGLSVPFLINGHIFVVAGSIGGAIGRQDGRDAEELIASADYALYEAKKSGGRVFRAFNPGMRTSALERRVIQDELLEGLHRNELVLHYQPQVDLRTKSVFGFEALLRWQHPTKGLLLPKDFLPALHASAVGLSIGRWVMDEACRQMAVWSKMRNAPQRIGVNVFPSEFSAGGFAEGVQQSLTKHGLVPEQLEIELTEDIVLEDNDSALETLGRLQALGVRIALDDFGTGYASLSALKRVPLTTLKIDRSFVTDLSTNPHDASIARAMLSMGEELGLDIIAEGIETGDQEAILLALGCKAGQGFRYGRAMPADRATDFIDNVQRISFADADGNRNGELT